jgi:hypothetical protein
VNGRGAEFGGPGQIGVVVEAHRQGIAFQLVDGWPLNEPVDGDLFRFLGRIQFKDATPLDASNVKPHDLFSGDSDCVRPPGNVLGRQVLGCHLLAMLVRFHERPAPLKFVEIGLTSNPTRVK